MRRRRVGAIAATARAAPSTAAGAGSTPACVAAMTGSPTATPGGAASSSTPSLATRRRTPSDSTTATTNRSTMSMTNADGQVLRDGRLGDPRIAFQAGLGRAGIQREDVRLRRDLRHAQDGGPADVRRPSNVDRVGEEERAAGQRHRAGAQHHDRDERDRGDLADAIVRSRGARSVGRSGGGPSSRGGSAELRSRRGAASASVEAGSFGDRPSRPAPHRAVGGDLGFNVGHHRTLRSA